ncbi:MAG: DUF4912 domain-containing protein [Bacillota bacterium]
MPNESSYDTEFSEELNIDIDTESIPAENEEKNVEEKSYEWKNNELKYKYNKTLVRLISRDPNWLYAYWEVTEPEFYENKPVLRLIVENEKKYYDIDINHEIDNWYIDQVKPKNKYKVALGYKKNDKFIPLTYSNSIITPPDKPSDNLDERWMYIQELDKYVYKIDINSSLSLMESLKRRKEKEELNISSYPFNN